VVKNKAEAKGRALGMHKAIKIVNEKRKERLRKKYGIKKL